MVKKKNSFLFCLFLCVITLIFLSGCVEINCAYLPTGVLPSGWHENTSLRNSGIQLLGLEKWCGSSYEIGGRYPAILTVNSIQTIMLPSEEQLKEQVRTIIIDTFKLTMTPEEIQSGSRINQKNHETQYLLFQGYDTIKNASVLIIGEVWNCAVSGTSILCIGIAYTTNQYVSNTSILTQWNTIASDPAGTITDTTSSSGLLYQVKCH